MQRVRKRWRQEEDEGSTAESNRLAEKKKRDVKKKKRDI